MNSKQILEFIGGAFFVLAVFTLMYFSLIIFG
jgi:hypothetical protein